MARPKRRSTSKSNGSSSRRQQPEQDTANENYYNPSDSFIEAKTRSADTDDDGSSDEGETGATMEQSVFDLNVGDSSSDGSEDSEDDRYVLGFKTDHEVHHDACIGN
eukprot:TRINITY_DN1087_c2_g1_i1.p2 TRINITY_DN1087_c2_g1~~TRINITY_DN1087_c2_g1_i1.p2  ORF type:complete len:107 (-),score=26.86 TRINITY_DN1087_c2_g1_i1:70-390(-)